LQSKKRTAYIAILQREEAEMRSSRPLRLFVAGVTVMYLAFVVSLAVTFADRMPPIAWVGYGVVVMIATTLAVAAIVFFERIEREAGAEAGTALDPATDGRRHVLVVADAGCEARETCTQVLSRIHRGSNPDVLVVAPTLASPLHHMMDDNQDERGNAGERLREVVSFLREEGIAARGLVGSDLPLEAMHDALTVFPATEIVVLAPTDELAEWSERGLAERARTAFARPVAEVAVPKPA
jgi:hypothetical protein